jgi:hypothetical protein
MSFEETIDTLRTLRGNLCAALRRGEMLWLGMASDYQSKYAFSADYDTSFKQGYYEQATTCREIAEKIETLTLPTRAREIPPFITSARSATEHCPLHPEIQGPVEQLIAEMASIASAARVTDDTSL